MPKKSKPESPEEQSERFKREVQELIDAGELDPDAAEAALNDLMRPPKRSGSR
jgi:polyhydroxyalkanoate synthesis regulator phasin